MGLELGIRDPRSGIRNKTYSGSRIRVQGQKGTGSRIRICNTGFKQTFFTTMRIRILESQINSDPDPKTVVCTYWVRYKYQRRNDI
jgi:hypothetical protein